MPLNYGIGLHAGRARGVKSVLGHLRTGGRRLAGAWRGAGLRAALAGAWSGAGLRGALAGAWSGAGLWAALAGAGRGAAFSVALAGCAMGQGPGAVRPKIAVEAPAVLGSISEQDLAEARFPRPAPELKVAPGKRDFDLQGDGTTLYEQVGKALGLDVVFDRDYQPVTKRRFLVEGVNFREAIRALQAATDTFVVPMGERRIFVARDTLQKRQLYDRVLAVVVPIPEGVTTQEIQEVANAVRSALDIRRLMADPEKRMVIIRDVAGKVRTAELLVEDLMRPRPQVDLELELMTTTSDVASHYGLSLPASFPLVDFFGNGGNLLGSALPSGVSGFLTFGGGATFIGIGLSSTTLWATASRSVTKTLQKAEMVASDGLPTTFKVGTKYPVVTNAYVGPTSSIGQVFAPPPTVNFEDLGLVLKVTPHVHGMEEVSLDLEAQFRLIVGTAANGIPIISNREYKGTVRVRAGQMAVLAGLMSASDAKTATGIMGLMDLPVIGKLLSERTSDVAHDDTLIVVKPRIVIRPPAALAVHEAWVGTETRPVEPL